jgi:hypothetical protein
MEARRGRDAADGSMRSTTARPAVSWPGTPESQEVPENQLIDEYPGTDKHALVKTLHSVVNIRDGV